MKPITKNEAEILKKNNWGNKVKKSGTKRHAYCVEDYNYKFDSNGNVIKAEPTDALKFLYEYRKSVIIK